MSPPLDESPVPLPRADETARCADYTRALGADPGGSAFRADLVVAVDTPLPWPKPVFVKDVLHGVADAVQSAAVPTRVLAAVPGDDDQLQVVAYRRRPNGTWCRSAWLTDGAGLADTAIAVVAGVSPSRALTVELDVVQTDESPSEVWVCTQGSHDICCGTEGTRFASALANARPDVVVRRVSHTGGHRFAPTALTLPGGRLWANLDLEVLDRVLDGTVEAAEIGRHCRGWTGMPGGAPQVAERAVRAHLGPGWMCTDVSLVSEHDDGSTHRVTGAVDGGSVVAFELDVTAGREIYTIACRAPGGLPAKSTRELHVTRLESVPTDELPSGLQLARTTPVFDEDSVPAGLLGTHRVADGVWGRLVVGSGSLTFTFDDEPESPLEVAEGQTVVIPPAREHHLTVDGPVSFVVEFHRPPSPDQE